MVKNRRDDVICRICGKKFSAPKSEKRKYCSISCYRKSQRGNSWILNDSYAKLIIKSNRYGESVVLVDREDYEKVSKLQWHVTKSSNYKNYIASNIYKSGKIYLHRFITNCPKDKCIDHINGNTFDNRKLNLKICTIAENNKNFGMSKANKTGYKHISIDKNNNKFILNVKGKFYGRYDTVDDALIKRKEVYNELLCS